MAEEQDGAEREAAIEKQRIEWVFGLTGGELETEPWVFWTQSESSTDGTPLFDKSRDDHASWFMEWQHRYWYDGAPDYAEREFKDEDVGAVRTLVEPGGVLTAPHHELYDGDGVWKLKATYGSSGEAECPGRNWDRDQEGDMKGTTGRVSTEGRCHLCEENPGDEHGYIYLGVGGYEAVYVLERQVSDGDYIKRARSTYDDDDTKIDDDAKVSRVESGYRKGAWVAAWVWVDEE